jgi:DNA invertase Pin-like site-specific DNA recombinase
LLNPRRAAIYYRVSTDTQHVENQILDLKKYVEIRKWLIEPDHVFVDDAVSSTKKRGKLEEIMTLARRRKFDVLLVWAYDRFARSTTHLIHTLDELNAHGVDFVSYVQQIDTTTPSGRLLYSITASFAEYERSMIVERTKAGLRRVVASGRRLGRPVVPDEVREKIYELSDGGLSVRKIAAQIEWVRASGKYGTRKVAPISKSLVGKVLKLRASSTQPIPNVA